MTMQFDGQLLHAASTAGVSAPKEARHTLPAYPPAVSRYATPGILEEFVSARATRGVGPARQTVLSRKSDCRVCAVAPTPRILQLQITDVKRVSALLGNIRRMKLRVPQVSDTWYFGRAFPCSFTTTKISSCWHLWDGVRRSRASRWLRKTASFPRRVRLPTQATPAVPPWRSRFAENCGCMPCMPVATCRRDMSCCPRPSPAARPPARPTPPAVPMHNRPSEATVLRRRSPVRPASIFAKRCDEAAGCVKRFRADAPGGGWKCNSTGNFCQPRQLPNTNFSHG